jgi:DNA mismatch repair protein MutS
MAGLPAEVISRARDVLARHEQAEHRLTETLTPPPHAPDTPTEQQPLFTPLDRTVLDALRRAELNRLTPIEALNLLAELKKQIS